MRHLLRRGEGGAGAHRAIQLGHQEADADRQLLVRPQPANRPAWSPIMTPCVASARLCPAPALMERPVAPSNIRVSADDPMLDAGDRLMLMITPLSPGLTIRTLPTAAPCHCREALSISGAMETSGEIGRAHV